MYCKLYKFGKNLPSNMAALWASKPADLFIYAVPVFESYPKSVPEFIDPELDTKTSIFVKTSPKSSFSYQFVPRDASISMFWKRSD